MHSLSSAPPVYIRKVHQNTSGSAVSELMRFILHIITYVVPATPRVINWAGPLNHIHCLLVFNMVHCLPYWAYQLRKKVEVMVPIHMYYVHCMYIHV